MSKHVKRLGRGLSSLISDLRSETESPPPAIETNARTRAEPAIGEAKAEAGKRESTQPSSSHNLLSIKQLRPNPFQPRREVQDADIEKLAASIRRHGVLQPISARIVMGRYEIIAGERRWRAATMAGLAEVPVVVRETSDEEMLELALIENLQREDLNPIDRSEAYRRFCDAFGLHPEDLAERLGEDRTTVINYLRLLDLPDAVRGLVAGGRLSMGHARCLLGVSDAERQERLARQAVSRELSVRALEEAVKDEKKEGRGGSRAGRGMSAERLAHVRSVERRFEEAVRTRVTIKEGRRKGAGKIIIEYFTLDDFDRVANLLGVTDE